MRSTAPGSGKPKALASPSPPTPLPQGERGGKRRAIVLVAVMVIITVLALAGYRYADLATSEYRAADTAVKTTQAQALALSGVHYTAALLSTPTAIQNGLNGNPFDNPDRFANQTAAAESPGRFLVFTPLEPSEQGSLEGIRFGVSDENGKINLNAWLKRDKKGDKLFELLKKLPNMDESTAAAIVDWLDPDSTPRQGGAEDADYSDSGYRCKNGPIDSLDELLLVRGVTPQLLFGSDFNRNGVQDPGEPTTNGGFDRGWSAYLTLHSREQNLDSTNQPRININDTDFQALYTKLSGVVPTDMANYILSARMYGYKSIEGNSSQSKGKSKSGRGGAGLKILTMLTGGYRIPSIYDLIGTEVSVPSQDGKSPPTTYPCPLNTPEGQQQYLAALLDKTTTTPDGEIPARININTAPEAVLATLPNLTPSDVESIVANRPSLEIIAGDQLEYQTPAWLITQAKINPMTVKKLADYVTTRSQVYRFQVVGYFDRAGPTVRVEAVVDTNAGRPRILSYRDLSTLGPGIDLQQFRSQ